MDLRPHHQAQRPRRGATAAGGCLETLQPRGVAPWSHRCQISGFPKPGGTPMDGLQWKILLKMDDPDDPHELLDWVLALDPD